MFAIIVLDISNLYNNDNIKIVSSYYFKALKIQLIPPPQQLCPPRRYKFSIIYRI